MNDDEKELQRHRRAPSARDGMKRAGDEINDLMKSLGARFKLSDLPEHLPPPPPPPRDLTRRELAERRLRELPSLGWEPRPLEDGLHADETRMAIVEIERWAVDRATNVIVLSGEKGTGKTVAAAWWAMRCREHPHFVRATRLARIGRFGEAFDQLVEAEALCIDDLGAEYSDTKGSFAADLDELIDTYHARRRRLVITTNATATEFSERVGDRVFDRLEQCAQWVSLVGGSLRHRR